jgi:cytochrome b
MSSSATQIPAANAAPKVALKVWDWPVRLFHWSLAALALAALITAKLRGDAMVWHMRCGFAILALVLFRILWGFAGSYHARFGSFVRRPAHVVDYAKAVAGRDHPPSVGHNPVGGWSVVALLLVLLVQACTGLFANDDITTDGPLVKLVTKELSDTLTKLHHRNFWLLSGLIALHLGAVFYHLVVLKDNLIRPMLTGVKHLPGDIVGDDASEPATGRALLLLALCSFAVWWVVNKL